MSLIVTLLFTYAKLSLETIPLIGCYYGRDSIVVRGRIKDSRHHQAGRRLRIEEPFWCHVASTSSQITGSEKPRQIANIAKCVISTSKSIKTVCQKREGRTVSHRIPHKVQRGHEPRGTGDGCKHLGSQPVTTPNAFTMFSHFGIYTPPQAVNVALIVQPLPPKTESHRECSMAGVIPQPITPLFGPKHHAPPPVGGTCNVHPGVA